MRFTLPACSHSQIDSHYRLVTTVRLTTTTTTIMMMMTTMMMMMTTMIVVFVIIQYFYFLRINTREIALIRRPPRLPKDHHYDTISTASRLAGLVPLPAQTQVMREHVTARAVTSNRGNKVEVTSRNADRKTMTDWSEGV